MNFGKGTATWCLDSIVMNDDLMGAHKRIRNNRTNGQSLRKNLTESKKSQLAASSKLAVAVLAKLFSIFRRQTYQRRNMKMREGPTKQTTISPKKLSTQILLEL